MGRANLSKVKLINRKTNFEKMAENWYSNLIANWEMLKVGFIKKYISSEIGGGNYSVLVNYP